MNEVTYRVIVDDRVQARDMDLTTALTLAEALFHKWYDEPRLAITIEREDSHACTMAMESEYEIAK